MPQHKRRFVWTAELHSKFERACEHLGLDSAKPKTILRHMDVEGLTKANIKSHLQKYRCMMQKRHGTVGAMDGGGDSDGSDHDDTPGPITLASSSSGCALVARSASSNDTSHDAGLPGFSFDANAHPILYAGRGDHMSHDHMSRVNPLLGENALLEQVMAGPTLPPSRAPLPAET